MSEPIDLPARFAELEQWLLAPPAAIPLDDLMPQWQETVIEMLCERPTEWVDGPSGHVWPNRVRGGLLDLARTVPVPDADYTLSAVLNGSFHRPTRGLDILRPMVPAVRTLPDKVVVSVSLFGVAGALAEPVCRLLYQVLQTGLGPRHDRGEMRLRPLSYRIGRALPVPPPAEPAAAMLVFERPLRLTKGDVEESYDMLPTLLPRLLNRVSGLARWMGCRVEADWPALSAQAAILALDAAALGLAPTWERRSSRQQRSVPMHGLSGALTLEGDLRPFAGSLAMGARCHTGRDAALGLGRYRIVWATQGNAER